MRNSQSKLISKSSAKIYKHVYTYEYSEVHHCALVQLGTAKSGHRECSSGRSSKCMLEDGACLSDFAFVIHTRRFHMQGGTFVEKVSRWRMARIDIVVAIEVGSGTVSCVESSPCTAEMPAPQTTSLSRFAAGVDKGRTFESRMWKRYRGAQALQSRFRESAARQPWPDQRHAVTSMQQQQKRSFPGMFQLRGYRSELDSSASPALDLNTL